MFKIVIEDLHEPEKMNNDRNYQTEILQYFSMFMSLISKVGYHFNLI